MENKIRVVIIEPDKPAHITEIEDSLASMQAVVEGYIQVISASAIPGGKVLNKELKNLILVLNEEGKIDKLPFNFKIYDGADYIAGTCFVCKEKEEEMVGLSQEEAELVVALFDRKENANG